MNATEITTRMADHLGHLTTLLGQFEAAISEREARLKALPDVTKKLEETTATLAKKTDELTDVTARLDKSKADRARALKHLQTEP